MDSSKFDRMARILAASPSRRSVVRGLAAVALGAGVVTKAEAADEDLGRCPNGNNKQCGDNQKCRNERCVCDDGFKVCKVDGRNRCVDQDNDDANCGDCGRRCDNQKRCMKGKCERVEDPGNDRCAQIGQRCDNGLSCCSGLACRAGNNAFRACVLA